MIIKTGGKMFDDDLEKFLLKCLGILIVVWILVIIFMR